MMFKGASADAEYYRDGPRFGVRFQTMVDKASQNARRNNGSGRWLRESRLAMAAFVMFGVIALLWMVPWAPAGLNPNTYSPEVIFTIFLLAGFAATGIIAFALRDLARRDQARVAALGEFYDEATGMNNRFYLLDRLAARAERAGRKNDTFALMIFRFHATDVATGKPIAISNPTLQDVGQAVTRLVRRGDLVATLGSSEFAIVANAFSPTTSATLTARIEEALLNALAGTLDTKVEVNIETGVATFPADGRQPDALVAAARPIPRSVEAAAA